MAKQLKWANDHRARYVLILGPREHAENSITIRDMESGEQEKVLFSEVARNLYSKVQAR
jgi:histidyl-tRNA synthetase